MFPNGLSKAFTLSYDDGTAQDARFTEIINKYGLKCTFNLNSGTMRNPEYRERNGAEVTRLSFAQAKEIYAGHEIAAHTVTHPRLETLAPDAIGREVADDRTSLGEVFGAEVIGMAYPFGTYNEATLDELKKQRVCYSRTTKSTHGFDLPEDFLLWHPTCHHKDEDLFTLANAFLRLKTDKPAVFYLWGHSFEFDTENNPLNCWRRFEDFCRIISGFDDVWYATNGDIFRASRGV
ncbi:MAG: polysaccharide deacetylase family protein [Clostridiales bacterium]|jgi:peptidoglycan/xylan/chitin deacetylase (PgdA/CDA1 family)|nr:polysaccharide deacetylase family protein [Clostridiales bacterium]